MHYNAVRLLIANLAWLPFAVALASPVDAANVTFGTSNIDELVLAGPQFEGPVKYQVISGLAWEIVNSHDTRGNPPSALATFYNGSPTDQSLGDKVEFRLTNGGLFRFVSVDTRANSDAASSDRVSFTGTLNGNLVSTINPIPTNTYVTNSGFAGQMDTLTVAVTLQGFNALWIDNLQLEIPEPTTQVTLGLALFGMAVVVRRRTNCSHGQ